MPTVEEVEGYLTEFFQLRDDLEVRLLNENDHRLHRDRKVPGITFRPNECAGIRTIADLNRRIKNRFKTAGLQLTVVVWDTRANDRVQGRTLYENMSRGN